MDRLQIPVNQRPLICRNQRFGQIVHTPMEYTIIIPKGRYRCKQKMEASPIVPKKLCEIPRIRKKTETEPIQPKPRKGRPRKTKNCSDSAKQESLKFKPSDTEIIEVL